MKAELRWVGTRMARGIRRGWGERKERRAQPERRRDVVRFRKGGWMGAELRRVAKWGEREGRKGRGVPERNWRLREVAGQKAPLVPEGVGRTGEASTPPQRGTAMGVPRRGGREVGRFLRGGKEGRCPRCRGGGWAVPGREESRRKRRRIFPAGGGTGRERPLPVRETVPGLRLKAGWSGRGRRKGTGRCRRGRFGSGGWRREPQRSRGWPPSRGRHTRPRWLWCSGRGRAGASRRSRSQCGRRGGRGIRW